MRRAPAKPCTLRRVIRAPRKAHLREEGTSEHVETKTELKEVEGGARRRRGVGNKVEGAREAPMAGGDDGARSGGERARERA